MGKDFVYVRQNGWDLLKAYKLLFSGSYEVVEASDERYFRRIPQFFEVDEIELGTDGTKESILRLKDGGFVVVDKTFDVKKLGR